MLSRLFTSPSKLFLLFSQTKQQLECTGHDPYSPAGPPEALLGGEWRQAGVGKNKYLYIEQPGGGVLSRVQSVGLPRGAPPWQPTCLGQFGVDSTIIFIFLAKGEKVHFPRRQAFAPSKGQSLCMVFFSFFNTPILKTSYLGNRFSEIPDFWAPSRYEPKLNLVYYALSCLKAS